MSEHRDPDQRWMDRRLADATELPPEVVYRLTDVVLAERRVIDTTARLTEVTNAAIAVRHICQRTTRGTSKAELVEAILGATEPVAWECERAYGGEG